MASNLVYVCVVVGVQGSNVVLSAIGIGDQEAAATFSEKVRNNLPRLGILCLIHTDLVMVCLSWLRRWASPLSCSMLTPAQPPTSLSGSTRSSAGEGHI